MLVSQRKWLVKVWHAPHNPKYPPKYLFLTNKWPKWHFHVVGHRKITKESLGFWGGEPRAGGGLNSGFPKKLMFLKKWGWTPNQVRNTQMVRSAQINDTPPCQRSVHLPKKAIIHWTLFRVVTKYMSHPWGPETTIQWCAPHELERGRFTNPPSTGNPSALGGVPPSHPLPKATFKGKKILWSWLFLFSFTRGLKNGGVLGGCEGE